MPRQPPRLVLRIGRLDLVVLDVFLLLLVHFPIGTPTEEEEGQHDEDAADDGCERERLAGAKPVDDGYHEDGQEGGYR